MRSAPMTNQYMQQVMGLQFFGEFLIDRWVINRKQLLDALSLQAERNLKLEQIALRKNVLSQEQIEALSTKLQKVPISFGELAISEGYLTAEQLQSLISFQENNNIYIGEALLRLGYIDQRTLKRELELFEERQKQFVLEEIPVPEGVAHALTITTALQVARVFFRRFIGLELKFGKGCRMSSCDLLLDYYLGARICLDSEHSLCLMLSVSKEIALEITSHQIHSDANHEPREVHVDAIKEFINIICGNTAALMSKHGKNLMRDVPQEVISLDDVKDHTVLAFPVHANIGSLDLRFFYKEP